MIIEIKKTTGPYRKTASGQDTVLFPKVIFLMINPIERNPVRSSCAPLMRHDPLYWICYTIFCLAGGILGYFIGHMDSSNHQITMKIEVTEPVETQLFYDTGSGFNEKESVKQMIYQTDEPVILDFSFPGQSIRALRFDPSRTPTQMKIHEITIRYREMNPFNVPLDSLVTANDILFQEYDGKILTIKTSATGKDPIILLTQIGSAPHSSLFKNLIHIVVCAGVALGVAFFSVCLYRNTMQ